MKIIVASKNAHKVKELSEMLALADIELVSLRDMGFEGEIEENGSTFEENALIKARAACAAYRLPALADDSGLCVDALGGEPGIYSARYASADGENADDAANVEKLLSKLTDVPDQQRTGRFICAIALALPDGTETVVSGACEGVITREIHGDGGFGYDPVFFYEPYGKTFGETSDKEKNAVSHRAAAVRLIKAELLRMINV